MEQLSRDTTEMLLETLRSIPLVGNDIFNDVQYMTELDWDDKTHTINAEFIYAINMHLPVPFEMVKQLDFRDYRAFLERTVNFVEPILKLDRLYPDPIMFRLTW